MMGKWWRPFIAGGCFGPWLAPCILAIVWESSGIWKPYFMRQRTAKGFSLYRLRCQKGHAFTNLGSQPP